MIDRTIKYLTLALKNLSRHRRRSLLTASVMAASAAALIFAVALGEAFYHQLVNVGISTTTGHIQILAPGVDFDIINPVSGSISRLKHPDTIEARIRNMPHLKAVGREIIIQAMIYDHDDRVVYGTIVGAEPEYVDQTLSGVKLTRGTTFSSGVQNGVMLSPLMTRRFKPSIDDPLYLIAPNPLGMLDGVKAKYTGTVRSMPLFANHVAYTDIGRLQGLLGWPQGACTAIKIILTDKAHTESCATWLKAKLSTVHGDVNVQTWAQLSGFYVHIALLGRVLVAFLVVLLALVAAISVSNTMLMSTRERTREIGTMMAMGMKRSDIVRLFVLESFGLSVIATMGGALLGSAITAWYQKNGFLEGLSLVIEGRLYPVLAWWPVLLTFVWILGIGTAGGIHPARRAASLDPIEALRHL